MEIPVLGKIATCEVLLMAEILHQFISSLSHYLWGFSTIPGGARFQPSTVSVVGTRQFFNRIAALSASAWEQFGEQNLSYSPRKENNTLTLFLLGWPNPWWNACYVWVCCDIGGTVDMRFQELRDREAINVNTTEWNIFQRKKILGISRNPFS